MAKDAHIDDIALFFSQDGNVDAKRWVSHDVYADPEQSLGPPNATWASAIFLQDPTYGCYVVNLSMLNPPGQGLSPQNGKKKTVEGHIQPQAGDLVVIPWDDAQTAYLVPKARYEACPPIGDSSGADLQFMAVTEGVVLANVPKTDLAGLSCTLLNLRALRATPNTKKST